MVIPLIILGLLALGGIAYTAHEIKGVSTNVKETVQSTGVEFGKIPIVPIIAGVAGLVLSGRKEKSQKYVGYGLIGVSAIGFLKEYSPFENLFGTSNPAQTFSLDGETITVSDYAYRNPQLENDVKEGLITMDSYKSYLNLVESGDVIGAVDLGNQLAQQQYQATQTPLAQIKSLTETWEPTTWWGKVLNFVLPASSVWSPWW